MFVLFSVLVSIWMNLLHGLIHDIVHTLHFLLLFMPDAVAFWSRLSPWKEDRPPESRCLRRDHVQEGRLSSPFVSPLVFLSPSFHPHLLLLLVLLFSTSRPPPLPWKGPSNLELDTPWATSAPSPREMCWCKTFTWSKASSSRGVFSQTDAFSCADHFYLTNLPSFLHSEGSNLTPAHHYPDFRFKTYAPVAFRYFRELFGIRPDDYLVSYTFSPKQCATSRVEGEL